MSNRFIVGLTGGICSGKSTVAKIFEQDGATVVDCDIVAKSLLSNDDIKQQIRSQFGDNIFDKDGNIINSKLKEAAFDSVQNVKKLNDIMWTPTKEKVQSIIEANEWFIVVDCALLFESRLNRLTDFVININCSEDIRKTRILKRDGTDKYFDIIKSCQYSDSHRFLKSNYTIENNETIDAFKKKITLCRSKLATTHYAIVHSALKAHYERTTKADFDRYFKEMDEERDPEAYCARHKKLTEKEIDNLLEDFC